MRDLQKPADDHDVLEKMDHLVLVCEVVVKEDRGCQSEHRKTGCHSLRTKTKNQQQPAADLEGVKPILAASRLPGFKVSSQPVLAQDKVRHVGEAIAVCMAPTRAEAEDLAAAVEVDLSELPAVVAIACRALARDKHVLAAHYVPARKTTRHAA